MQHSVSHIATLLPAMATLNLYLPTLASEVGSMPLVRKHATSNAHIMACAMWKNYIDSSSTGTILEIQSKAHRQWALLGKIENYFENSFQNYFENSFPK
jgi:hypothetical protein